MNLDPDKKSRKKQRSTIEKKNKNVMAIGGGLARNEKRRSRTMRP